MVGGEGWGAIVGGWGGAGGRHGRHSEDFEPLWEEMTKLYRDHPGATW
jgi:ring-1,2-phenylacetyl-CoA epoxidase subunit PaaC